MNKDKFKKKCEKKDGELKKRNIKNSEQREKRKKK